MLINFFGINSNIRNNRVNTIYNNRLYKYKDDQSDVFSSGSTGETISFGSQKQESVSEKFYKKLNSENAEEKELFLCTIAESPAMFLYRLPANELKNIYLILQNTIEKNKNLTDEMLENCHNILNDISKYLKFVETEPKKTIDEKRKTIDISSKGEYPSNVLSNFYKEKEPFYVDGIPCNSMEGFLQSLKINNIEIQKELCSKSGLEAKQAGKPYTSQWQESQTLYWDGKPYKRDSKEYIDLIKKSYIIRLNSSQEFKKALIDSKGYKLTHNAGYNNTQKSILTPNEFISILQELRDTV